MATRRPGAADAQEGGGSLTVIALGHQGVVVSGDTSIVLDVGFDGSRVWSFRADRDAASRGEDAKGHHVVPWPDALAALLDGEVDVTVSEHLSGRVLHEAPHRFGTRRDRIRVVDADGRPLAVGKLGDLVPTFASRSAEQVAPLLDALEQVLGALAELGVEAFPSYGTLLGAVRDGRLIGHDDDTDVSYVSRHSTPVDASLESFDIQRRLNERGYRTRRYSGLAFKVEVVESDDLVRGLDVFGGFMTRGRLYLMGTVGVDYEPEWLFPLGTTVLEGRRLPAPAQPERLLEAMYGHTWRVPDPSFEHVVPHGTTVRLNSWFRGTRVKREGWDRHHRAVRGTARPDPSALARFVVDQEGVPEEVADLGAGRGADSLWLARQGARVTAYDYSVPALQEVAAGATAEGLDVTTRSLNLLELRSVLGEGARLAHRAGRRTVLARDLPGATTPIGRQGAWRFASMALRSGGRLYLEATLPGGAPSDTAPLVRPLAAPVLTRDLQESGATVIHHEKHESDESGRRTGRWVATWCD